MSESLHCGQITFWCDISAITYVVCLMCQQLSDAYCGCQQLTDEVIEVYTVSHKNAPLCFWVTNNSKVRERFLRFLYQWKREWMGRLKINAGPNEGPIRSKSNRHEWKMRDQISSVEKCRTGKFRTENAGLKMQDWKCRTGKWRTENSGWKMQD